jgi:hypothetical protein
LPIYRENQEVVVSCGHLLPNDIWHKNWDGGDFRVPHGRPHAELPMLVATPSQHLARRQYSS